MKRALEKTEERTEERTEESSGEDCGGRAKKRMIETAAKAAV